MVVIPLIDGDKNSVGIVHTTRIGSQEAFTDTDLSLLQELGHLLSIIISSVKEQCKLGKERGKIGELEQGVRGVMAEREALEHRLDTSERWVSLCTSVSSPIATKERRRELESSSPVCSPSFALPRKTETAKGRRF
jgi:hypothetical protein